MKLLKWMLFIPISVIAYFIAMIGIAFFYNLVPSLYENPILDIYIMPILTNLIGIVFCFFTGNAIIDTKNERTTKTVNIILSIIIIIIQVAILFLSYKSEEYNKVISSIVGLILGVLALVETLKNK